MYMHMCIYIASTSHACHGHLFFVEVHACPGRRPYSIHTWGGIGKGTYEKIMNLQTSTFTSVRHAVVLKPLSRKLEQNRQLDSPMGRKYPYSCPYAFKVLMRFMMSIGPFSYAPSQLLHRTSTAWSRYNLSVHIICPRELPSVNTP